MVILYVDPLDNTRSVRSTLLRSSDVTVHESSTAEDAVEIAQKLPRLDVLVAEGILGQYTGFDLRDAIREKFPTLRAVFTSRYDLSDYKSFFSNCPVFFEPFDDEQLIKEICTDLTGIPSSKTEAKHIAELLPQPQISQPLLAVPVAETRSAQTDDKKKPSGIPAIATPAAPLQNSQTTSETPLPAPAFASEEAATQEAPHLKNGEVLGNYIVQERFYHERTTETYRALQQGVSREVALVLLKPEFAKLPESLSDFLERQRIKASVSHPRIAPLYESVQTGPYQFYTRELPHGSTLQQWQNSGRRFTEKVIADIAAGVADAMSYATARGYNYRMLTARDIFIDSENNPSIVNVFRPAGPTPRDYESDTKRFIALLRPVADGPRARHLLDELGRDLEDWDDLRDRSHDFQEEFRERSLLKRADTREAQDIQASQSATIPIWAYVLGSLIIAGLIVGIFVRGSIESTEPVMLVEETMVQVPAGSFGFQKNQTPELPAYWIDKYEVTLGQYAEFLKALEADPASAKNYDHPDQPPEKSGHKPSAWDPVYTAATTGVRFNNERVDLNTPVFGVDWWDAYAYAKWKGRRLPTEEEWEKAARGTDRRTFPWGNNADSKKVNLGLDYQPKETGGNIDGFNLWAPVNELMEDLSPYGIIGMGGNVDEWTATWANHPDFPDLKVPIVRGGHYALRSLGNILTDRTYPDTAETTTSTRGFRTASDKAPSPINAEK